MNSSLLTEPSCSIEGVVRTQTVEPSVTRPAPLFGFGERVRAVGPPSSEARPTDFRGPGDQDVGALSLEACYTAVLGGKCHRGILSAGFVLTCRNVQIASWVAAGAGARRGGERSCSCQLEQRRSNGQDWSIGARGAARYAARVLTRTYRAVRTRLSAPVSMQQTQVSLRVRQYRCQLASCPGPYLVWPLPSPTATPRGAHLQLHVRMSLHSMGRHVPSPTATPRDAHLQLHVRMSLHSMSRHVPSPPATPRDAHLQLHVCMSLHSMGRHVPSPTATPQGAPPLPQIDTSLRSTGSHVPSPTAVSPFVSEICAVSDSAGRNFCQVVSWHEPKQ